MGHSDPIDQWYESQCVPAVEKALGKLVGEWVRRGSKAELERLKAEERLEPATTVSGKSPKLGAHESALTANEPAQSISPPQAPQPLSKPSIEKADFWRVRRAEFDALLARQRSMLGEETREEWLKAYCDFSSDHGEFGRCQLRGGFDGRLISDFEDVATQAANALGCPPGVDPTAFWLYNLAKDLLKASKRQIRREFSPGGEWGGYIQGLLESSAGYCSRLAAKADRQGIDNPRRPDESLGSKVSSLPEPGTASAESTDPQQRMAAAKEQTSHALSELGHTPTVMLGSFAERWGSVLRLQALKFALREVFQEGQTTPLKSWAEVREELLSIASDESIPIDLRTKIGEEMNPQDDALRSLLNSTSPELHREAGRIIIDRVLEPNEVTQFRRSPEHRERVLSERCGELTAHGFDDIEREDPDFFSVIIQAASRADKTKFKRPADKLSPSREEQYDLLRRFTEDHLGLSGFALVSALQSGEWRRRFMSYLQPPLGRAGRPLAETTDKIHAEWVRIGRPKITAPVCDRIARLFFSNELGTMPPGSHLHRKVRERVRRALQRVEKRTAT